MDFLEAARSLEGTPFHWHQRVPGPTGGIDCLGLVIAAMKLSNNLAQDFDFRDYGNNATNLKQMFLTMGSPYFNEVTQAESGDVVILKIKGRPRHLGILDSDTLIHAHMLHGVMLDHWDRWLPRTDSIFRLK